MLIPPTIRIFCRACRNRVLEASQSPQSPSLDHRLASLLKGNRNPRFQAGDRVVLNGCGLGEVHHGGYAERARVSSDWLIKLPEAISTRHAMAIGTAGYTAMLCVLALEKAGVMPDRGL